MMDKIKTMLSLFCFRSENRKPFSLKLKTIRQIGRAGGQAICQQQSTDQCRLASWYRTFQRSGCLVPSSLTEDQRSRRQSNWGIVSLPNGRLK
jgi:hypothetical protein